MIATTDTAFLRLEHATVANGEIVEIFRPNESCRGPWDAGACHAGPPTGLIARAAEKILPEHRLVRLTVELIRPIPIAGFTITSEVTRAGRSAATATFAIVDLASRVVARANTSHIAPKPDDSRIPSTTVPITDFAAARSGESPMSGIAPHGLPFFGGAHEVLLPPDQDGSSRGPKTIWMRTINLLAGELPSPFQRICPLADCGNGLSRLAELNQIGFINTDLTIHLHRPPIGEWMGSQVVSTWNSDGIGLADALLFDRRGPVGRAMQSLIITPF